MSRRNHAEEKRPSKRHRQETIIKAARATSDSAGFDPNQLMQLDLLHQFKTENNKASWTKLVAKLLGALPTQSIPHVDILKSTYASYINNSRTIEGISEHNPEARVIFHEMISELIGTTPHRHQLVTVTRILSWALFRPHQEQAHFTVHAIRHFIQIKPARVLVRFSAAQQIFLQKAKLCFDHPEEIERIHEWNAEAVFGTTVKSTTAQNQLSALESAIEPAPTANPKSKQTRRPTPPPRVSQKPVALKSRGSEGANAGASAAIPLLPLIDLSEENDPFTPSGLSAPPLPLHSLLSALSGTLVPLPPLLDLSEENDPFNLSDPSAAPLPLHSQLSALSGTLATEVPQHLKPTEFQTLVSTMELIDALYEDSQKQVDLVTAQQRFIRLLASLIQQQATFVAITHAVSMVFLPKDQQLHFDLALRQQATKEAQRGLVSATAEHDLIHRLAQDLLAFMSPPAASADVTQKTKPLWNQPEFKDHPEELLKQVLGMNALHASLTRSQKAKASKAKRKATKRPRATAARRDDDTETTVDPSPFSFSLPLGSMSSSRKKTKSKGPQRSTTVAATEPEKKSRPRTKSPKAPHFKLGFVNTLSALSSTGAGRSMDWNLFTNTHSGPPPTPTPSFVDEPTLFQAPMPMPMPTSQPVASPFDSTGAGRSMDWHLLTNTHSGPPPTPTPSFVDKPTLFQAPMPMPMPMPTSQPVASPFDSTGLRLDSSLALRSLEEESLALLMEPTALEATLFNTPE